LVAALILKKSLSRLDNEGKKRRGRMRAKKGVIKRIQVPGG
jgi:hypothetical protein